jgi:hypothetical protein
VRYFFVGTLEQVNEPVLEIQVADWQNMIIVVLKMPKTLHVYLTKKDFQKEEGLTLDPVQKIDTSTTADRFALFKNGEELLLVSYVIKNEAANELM